MQQIPNQYRLKNSHMLIPTAIQENAVSAVTSAINKIKPVPKNSLVLVLRASSNTIALVEVEIFPMSRKTYPNDLKNSEWAILDPLISVDTRSQLTRQSLKS
jgi:hypothetical protein